MLEKNTVEEEDMFVYFQPRKRGHYMEVYWSSAHQTIKYFMNIYFLMQWKNIIHTIKLVLEIDDLQQEFLWVVRPGNYNKTIFLLKE